MNPLIHMTEIHLFHVTTPAQNLCKNSELQTSTFEILSEMVIIIYSVPNAAFYDFKVFPIHFLKVSKHPCCNLAKNVSLNCLRHPTTTSSPASNQAQIQVSIYKKKCLVRALSLQQSFFGLLYHFFLKCISKAFVRLGFSKPLSFRLRL